MTNDLKPMKDLAKKLLNNPGKAFNVGEFGGMAQISMGLHNKGVATLENHGERLTLKLLDSSKATKFINS